MEERRKVLSDDWYKFKEGYVIKGGMVTRNKADEMPTINEALHHLEGYCPFDYYWKPLQQPLIDRIFKKGTQPEGEKNYLHTSFINLDTDEEIISWINVFGPPFLPFDSEKIIKYEKNLLIDYRLATKIGVIGAGEYYEDRMIVSAAKGDIDLNHIKEEIWRLRNIVQIQNALEDNELLSLPWGTIRSLLNWAYTYVLSNSSAYNKRFSEMLTGREIISVLEPWVKLDSESAKAFSFYTELKFLPILYEMAIYFLDTTFNGVLNTVNPKRKNGRPYWGFSSLLSAIYMMFHLDSEKLLFPVQCQHVRCGNYFKPSSEKNDYCKEQCQKNAKSYRYKNAKRNEVIKMLKKGASINEIVEAVRGVEQSRIEGWISKFLEDKGVFG